MEKDREGFLRAIEQDPDDETTRLVFADWLDEQGEYDEATRQRQIPAARRWLADFGKDMAGPYGDEEEDRLYGNGLSVEQLVEIAVGCLDRGHGHTLGFDTPERAYTDGEEFWRNIQIVTGREVPEGVRGAAPFRCAC
jgi:uncharacterized protein (TIGR02996 family)